MSGSRFEQITSRMQSEALQLQSLGGHLMWLGLIEFWVVVRCYKTVIQGDQKVSVHLVNTIQSSGAHRRFDHPVHALYCNTQHTLLGCNAVPSGMDLPTFQKNLLPVVDSPKMGLTPYQTIRHHSAPPTF